jgi:hypothetical protein
MIQGDLSVISLATAVTKSPLAEGAAAFICDTACPVRRMPFHPEAQ